MDRLKEFDDLEKMLADAKIAYCREDNTPNAWGFDFHQLRADEDPGDRWTWDVVCNKGTYGYEQGLLEMWGKNMIDPEGYLTAKECFEKIKEIVENEMACK